DGVFQQCLIGKADLRSELKRVLPEWKWDKSVDELLENWFHNELNFDQRVLDVVSKLKSQGITIYGASNQEHHRAKYLLENTELKKYINEFFISAHLGVKKPDLSFYRRILQDVKVRPEEIAYWDDDMENVKSAKQLGIHGHLYTDFATFQTEIQKFFHS
ncbi:HAD-IA family hydrolase, partial [Candidatus Woesebacteria bacterium]|nr:HAD-IA family hydrolase [Candidatus Woesebacteria bacterium]